MKIAPGYAPLVIALLAEDRVLFNRFFAESTLEAARTQEFSEEEKLCSIE